MFFFSNRFGCLASLLISAIGTALDSADHRNLAVLSRDPIIKHQAAILGSPVTRSTGGRKAARRAVPPSAPQR